MIRDKITSHLRKEKGQAFQKKCVNYIKQIFFKVFPELDDITDITSCPSCKHGEDIWLSNRLRALLPVSIECKDRSKEFKLINQYYKQAVDQTRKLGRTDNISPLLITKRGSHDALGVLHLQDLLNLYLKVAMLEKQIKEQS